MSGPTTGDYGASWLGGDTKWSYYISQLSFEVALDSFPEAMQTALIPDPKRSR